jgi:hypothetical protein
MRRSRSWCFIVFGLLSTAPTAAVGAPSYYAAWKWAVSSVWAEEQTTAVAPATVDQPYCAPCGPTCGGFATSTGFQSYAVADVNGQELYLFAYPASTATGSCQAGGRARADSRFDVTFTCPPGTASPIQATMNFRAEGAAHVTNPDVPGNIVARLALSVSAGAVGSGGAVPFAGLWVPQDANTQTTSGVFATLPESNVLSGTFPAPTASVNIDGAGVGTKQFALVSEVTVELNSGTAWGEMDFNRYGNAVTLPVGMPVFTGMPAGCTCNSVDANINDNYAGVVAVADPPATASWGSVKARYR